MGTIERTGRSLTRSPTRSVALVSAFPPPIGGVTVHASRMADRLEHLGWDVRRIDTGTARRPAARAWAVARVLVRLAAVRLRGIRLVHFHTSKSSLAFLATAPLLRVSGVRIVLSIHSGAFLDWLGRNSVNARLLRRGLRWVDLVLLMNERQAAEVRALLGPDARTRVEATPSFVFPLRRASRPGRNGAEAFRITAMGGWKPFYAYEDVLAAAEAAVTEAEREVELDLVVSTVAGVDEYRREMLERSGRAPSAVRVRVLEDMNPEAVFDYLASRDLLVRPSRVDSYGLCVAEALFVGTPAIATDVCRRPAGTRLYRAGDVEALAALVVEYMTMRRGATDRVWLDESEDAAVRVAALYEELLSRTPREVAG